MYTPVIGLEIHIELKTKSKMFCSCLNEPLETHPNLNVCPICLGHPGILPTINKRAVEQLIKVGLALNSQVAKQSKFDRKNYFYPDLPKGYQISQYDQPLCLAGFLEIPAFKDKNSKSKKIRIRRIHLEEDTGRLIHPASHDYSLIDFNRAGVPLMELVTEPDISSAEEAQAFAEELQLILKYLEVSDADMEKGQMRVEVNVSLKPAKSSSLGVKVEIKNLNSFRAVARGIDYEIRRQTKILESDKKIIQETRGWDEDKEMTVSQREKEEAHDYRYLPEPDLPLLDLTDREFIDIEAIRSIIPELPREKRERLIEEFLLSAAEANLLSADLLTAGYFERTVSEFFADYPKLNESQKRQNIQLIFNYLTSDLRGFLNKKGIDFNDLQITPENFADLIALIFENKISSRTAKDLIPLMQETGLDPGKITEEKGLGQLSDEKSILDAIEQVIKAHQPAVKDYQAGKTTALQFLIGQVMARLKGRGNPAVVEKSLKKKLGG